eukprot:46390-Chlamydomonas_euryale.AAC.5
MFSLAEMNGMRTRVYGWISLSSTCVAGEKEAGEGEVEVKVRVRSKVVKVRVRSKVVKVRVRLKVVKVRDSHSGVRLDERKQSESESGLMSAAQQHKGDQTAGGALPQRKRHCAQSVSSILKYVVLLQASQCRCKTTAHQICGVVAGRCTPAGGWGVGVLLPQLRFCMLHAWYTACTA